MSLHILRAEEIALTLDEAIAIGLRDNRNILLKAEDIKKAKEKIKEAKASLWPSLTFTGGWSRSQEYYYKDISSTTTQFTVKQDLFKGGKIINTIKYNEYGLEVIQALLDKEKLETVLDIEKAFYTLLLSEKLSELNKAIVDNTRQHLDLIQARYANGEASESDVLKMESSLSNVNKVYESSFNQVEASQSLLRNLLFLNNDVQIKTDAELTCQPREVAFDEGFLKAMEKRPEIRQYKAKKSRIKNRLKLSKPITDQIFMPLGIITVVHIQPLLLVW